MSLLKTEPPAPVRTLEELFAIRMQWSMRPPPATRKSGSG